MQQTPTVESIEHMQRELSNTIYTRWMNQELFSPQWWFILMIAIVPWIIWIRSVDKKRGFEIFTFGLIVGVLAIILDSVGTSWVLWWYKVQLYSIAPPLFPADLTIVSVPFMLIYERYSRWTSYLLAITILSIFYSFIGENFLEWINIYELLTWKHIYSVPLYIAVGIVGKFTVIKFKEYMKNTSV